MSLASYGEHAERAADALDVLIRADSLPVAPVDVDHLLSARQAVVTALSDRLAHLRPNLRPRAAVAVTTEDLDNDPVALLAQAIRELPRLEHQPLSPIDALGSMPEEPAVAAWVSVGRELTWAGHVLDASPDKPWTTSPPAYWQLVSDTAQVLEAVTVLDQRLEETGLLPLRPQHRLSPAGRDLLAEAKAATESGQSVADFVQTNLQAPHLVRSVLPLHQGEPMSRSDVRILAGHLARMGTWYGDNAVTDLVYAPGAGAGNVKPAVRLVRVPGDLAPAQRQLGRYLDPGKRRTDPFAASAPRMDAWTAVRFVQGQMGVLEVIRARMSTSTLRDQLPRADNLTELLDDVRQGLKGLFDVAPAKQNKLAQNQLVELGSALRRHQGLRSLSDHQVVDFLDATESTLGRFAIAFRRESRRDDSQLRLLRRTSLDNPAQPTRIGRHKPGQALMPSTYLDSKITALAAYRPPSIPTAATAPHSRSALQDTLNRTPLRDHAPEPPGFGY